MPVRVWFACGNQLRSFGIGVSHPEKHSFNELQEGAVPAPAVVSCYETVDSCAFKSNERQVGVHFVSEALYGYESGWLIGHSG